MCFSATASFIAGGSLSAAGIFTIRRAKTRSRIPLAMIPLLFGIQQIIEGFVWLSFGMPALNTIATHAYVIFSHVLWPFFVPLAVMMIETGSHRKKALSVFVLFGLAVSLYLLFFIMAGPVTSSVVQKCIKYQVPNPESPWLLAIYLFVTSASCLVSSHRYIRWFGVAMFGSLLIALSLYRFTFYSVWCFFAAILSLIIFVHLGHKEKPRR